MSQKKIAPGAGGLTKAGKSAIARIEDFELQDLDCVGQKWPEMKAGNKAVIYFLFAGSCFINPTQAAWASIQLVLVPIIVGILSASMGIFQVGQAFEEQEEEDAQEEAGAGDEGGEIVDVESHEVEVADEDGNRENGTSDEVENHSSSRPNGDDDRNRRSYTSRPVRGTTIPDRPVVNEESSDSEPVFERNPWAKTLSNEQSQSTGSEPSYRAPTPSLREDPLSQRPLRAELPSEDDSSGSDHLSDAETAAAMAEFMAPSVNELLHLPVKERAERLLDALETSGCDLWSYINDPILVCQGTQQSGKSTMAVIVSILEAALYGKRINYITSNGDIYPVAFAAIGDGSEYYLQLADYLKTLQKDDGGEDIWITDELSKQPYEATSAVWNQLLSDFIKTGDTVRLIAHGTSAADMGLPKGRANQSKKEITILAAKRAVDVVGKKAARHLMKGGRYPSGQYQLQELQGDTLVDVPEERVQLPKWLQFETYTHPRTGEQIPCYVRSLLRYFPELDVRAQGVKPKVLFEETQRKAESLPSAEPQPGGSDQPDDSPQPGDSPQVDSVRSSLEGLLDAVDDESDPLKDVSELAQKLYAWAMTGAGRKLWQQAETRTAVLTIITADDVVLNGSRHRINGAPKNCHPFELADAISELVAIRKISKTREGHVVVETQWKSKEV